MMKLFSLKKRRKWGRKDTISTFDQLNMYMVSGLSIIDSLKLTRDTMSNRIKDSLAHIIDDVESGLLLYDSLSKYANISPSIRNFVEHGERAGQLAESIGFAKDLLEKQDELIKKCISALIYPIVVAVFSLVLIFGMIHGVLPQIIPMLQSMNVSLPILTRIMIYISQHLISYLSFLMITLAISIPLSLIFYKKYEIAKDYLHKISISIPIIGNIIFTFNLCIFLRSTGMLILSGLSLDTSYRNSYSQLNLIPLKKIIYTGFDSLEKGKTLASVFVNKKIPRYVPSLLAAGELSGLLGQSFIKSATIIEQNIDSIIKKTTVLIEPVMMIFLGGMVGCIALSILLPIYSLSQMLHHA